MVQRPRPDLRGGCAAMRIPTVTVSRPGGERNFQSFRSLGPANGAVDDSDSWPCSHQPTRCMSLAIELLHQFAAAAVIEPTEHLVWRVVATHDVAGELERDVLADVAAGSSHVAVEDALLGRAKGLVLGDDLARIVDLYAEPPTGHDAHVVDELADDLAGHRLRGEVRLDTQFALRRRRRRERCADVSATRDMSGLCTR